MCMIRHAIYLQHFVIVLLKDACDVFMQFIFPCFLNKCGPVFYCKNKLNMQLGIGICHLIRIGDKYTKIDSVCKNTLWIERFDKLIAFYKNGYDSFYKTFRRNVRPLLIYIC